MKSRKRIKKHLPRVVKTTRGLFTLTEARTSRLDTKQSIPVLMTRKINGGQGSQYSKKRIKFGFLRYIHSLL